MHHQRENMFHSPLQGFCILLWSIVWSPPATAAAQLSRSPPGSPRSDLWTEKQLKCVGGSSDDFWSHNICLSVCQRDWTQGRRASTFCLLCVNTYFLCVCVCVTCQCAADVGRRHDQYGAFRCYPRMHHWTFYRRGTQLLKSTKTLKCNAV